MSINPNIPMYSLSDVLESLTRHGNSKALEFASELTALSEDKLAELVGELPQKYVYVKVRGMCYHTARIPVPDDFPFDGLDDLICNGKSENDAVQEVIDKAADRFFDCIPQELDNDGEELYSIETEDGDILYEDPDSCF